MRRRRVLFHIARSVSSVASRAPLSKRSTSLIFSKVSLLALVEHRSSLAISLDSVSSYDVDARSLSLVISVSPNARTDPRRRVRASSPSMRVAAAAAGLHRATRASNAVPHFERVAVAMNALTQIQRTQKINVEEVASGRDVSASWHDQFRHSAYVYAGGLPFALTEGDVLCVFSQFGEIVDVNVVREEETGKSRGFAFVCYADQRSTVLAVDNLNGSTVGGRIIRVEHVDDYRAKNPEEKEGREVEREWKCACGSDNFKWRDACFKCGTPRPVTKREHEAEPEPGSDRARSVEDSRDVVDAIGPRSTVEEDDDARVVRELMARKAAAIARAEAAVKGLPIPAEDDGRDAKRHKKEKKEKKEKREKRRDD